MTLRLQVKSLIKKKDGVREKSGGDFWQEGRQSQSSASRWRLVAMVKIIRPVTLVLSELKIEKVFMFSEIRLTSTILENIVKPIPKSSPAPTQSNPISSKGTGADTIILRVP